MWISASNWVSEGFLRLATGVPEARLCLLLVPEVPFLLFATVCFPLGVIFLFFNDLLGSTLLFCHLLIIFNNLKFSENLTIGGIHRVSILRLVAAEGLLESKESRTLDCGGRRLPSASALEPRTPFAFGVWGGVYRLRNSLIISTEGHLPGCPKGSAPS